VLFSLYAFGFLLVNKQMSSLLFDLKSNEIMISPESFLALIVAASRAF
jgi:hypothetical protein